MADHSKSDTIVEDLNAAGDTVERYYCQQVTANNQLQDLVVPFYYDLAYPCDTSPEESRDLIADSLLYRAKQAFMEDASVCVFPQNELWFAAVSSRPPDQFADFDCQQLTDAACCTVVAGSMTFTQLSEADQDKVRTWVAGNLEDPTMWPAPGVTLQFLGTELAPDFREDPDQETITNDPPFVPANLEEPRTQPIPDDNSGFTMVGILILIGMAMIFVIAVVLIWKRRQRYIFERDIGAALQRSELGLHKTPPVMVLDHDNMGMAPTWEDRTLEDDDDNNIEVHDARDGNMQIRSVSNVSYRTTAEGLSNNNMHNSIAREPHLNDSNGSPRHYRFDLKEPSRQTPAATTGLYGSSADLFGPTEMTVVAPYSVTDDDRATNVSESEADSWAQTDGTVGSLEDGEPGHLLEQLQRDCEVGEI